MEGKGGQSREAPAVGIEVNLAIALFAERPIVTHPHGAFELAGEIVRGSAAGNVAETSALRKNQGGRHRRLGDGLPDTRRPVDGADGDGDGKHGEDR